MERYYTDDKEKKNKIIVFLDSKKIKYFYSEQYILLRQFECKQDDIEEINLERNFVYVFEWNNIKVKKEDLMAL